MQTNIELQSQADHLGLPLKAICYKDQLRFLPPPRPSQGYIVNLHDSGGPGTHWVAVAITTNNKAIYFDSFGMKPPLEVLSFLSNYHDVYYNINDIQDIDEGYCGEYCILFLTTTLLPEQSNLPPQSR